MKTTLLNITKTFTTEEEFVNSSEVKALFEGFENTMKRKVDGTKFLAAYVVATDPEANYGRAFDVYHFFQITDREYKGMLRLMKVTISSCLSDSGFQVAKVIGDVIAIDGGCYEKSDSNRKICIERGWIIF